MMDKLDFSCHCEECVFCFFTYSLKFLKFIFLVEIDDLKKITNSLTVLCSEKQKQEKVRERAGWKVCATDTGVDTAPPRRLVRGSREFTDAVYIGREQERECRGHPLFIDIFMFF